MGRLSERATASLLKVSKAPPQKGPTLATASTGSHIAANSDSVNCRRLSLHERRLKAVQDLCRHVGVHQNRVNRITDLWILEATEFWSARVRHMDNMPSFFQVESC